MRLNAVMNLEQPDVINKPSTSCLRLARYWVSLPFAAYLCSFITLGTVAIFVPAVVANAPLGIIGCFQQIIEPTPQQKAAIPVIHAIFWLIFATGLSLRQKLPLFWLRLIWIVIVTALIMSLGGCAAQLGPGFRDPGTFH
jgi:hypothetical protein